MVCPDAQTRSQRAVRLGQGDGGSVRSCGPRTRTDVVAFDVRRRQFAWTNLVAATGEHADSKLSARPFAIDAIHERFAKHHRDASTHVCGNGIGCWKTLGGNEAAIDGRGHRVRWCRALHRAVDRCVFIGLG